MNWLLDLPSPIRYLLILPIEFGVVALIAITLKKFGVNIRTAWVQGIKNAFFTSLFFCLIIGIISIISVLGFNTSASNGLSTSYSIILVVVLFWFYFNLFSVKFKAGQELLDVTAIPNGWLFVTLGIISIAIGFLGYGDFIWKNTEYSWGISVFIGLSCGLWFVIMGFSRIQIYENGILVYADLIKWSKIESYEWIDDNGKAFTLKFKSKSKMPTFLRTGAIPVPVEKKTQFASILKSFLSDSIETQNRA